MCCKQVECITASWSSVIITDCQQFPVLILQGKVSELPRRLGEEYKTVGGKE